MFKTLGQVINIMFIKTLLKILFQKHVVLVLKTAFTCTSKTYTQGINRCSPIIVTVKFMKTGLKLLFQKDTNHILFYMAQLTIATYTQRISSF